MLDHHISQHSQAHQVVRTCKKWSWHSNSLAGLESAAPRAFSTFRYTVTTAAPWTPPECLYKVVCIQEQRSPRTPSMVISPAAAQLLLAGTAGGLANMQREHMSQPQSRTQVNPGTQLLGYHQLCHHHDVTVCEPYRARYTSSVQLACGPVVMDGL